MGPKKKLESKDEFLMMLMKLKLYVLLEDLRDRFGISAALCGGVYNCWLRAVVKLLQHLIFSPYKEALLATTRTRISKCVFHARFL